MLALSCENKTITNQFFINGKYKGNDDTKLRLVYTDIDQNLVIDTIPLVNGGFTAKGFIQDITFAKILTLEDIPNRHSRISFFIEPGETQIELESGAFENANVSSGNTQIEYEILNKLERPIYNRIDGLILYRDSILNKQYDDKNSKVLLKRKKEISHEVQNKLDSIKSIRLNFSTENPNSLLSGFYVGLMYLRKLPIDSLMYYNKRFGENVKKSLFGKMLEQGLLEKSITSKIGDKAPSFSLKNVHNETVKLEDFKGKYILIDFWASSCVPCRKASPKLNNLYKKFHPKGVEFVGITSDSQISTWKKAIAKDKTTLWHHLRLGKESTSIGMKYNVQIIPTYILIDTNGVIIGRFNSSSDNNLNLISLEAKLESLFVDI
ncbi:TlpA disulfide reductase family protein [Cellulophaga sp. Hel_I_12]|uniref:TlpA disulfide reductase family protein n=1 Tax=Cellulophaga sp. Hel_I_12 TaxID=1249972 RepID=UPI0006490DCC|nr:TlpA disulfide reductase family protein [Cellulophaga sp. Hel_I_12]|tara:strand:+ start:351 stop:1487 length:1137 start_codon:yes stop_codon:yes gene_type:complete